MEAALENTLSLDGTTPNGMTANLDMNSQKIINVLAPNGTLDVVNKAYADSLLSGTTDTGSAQLRIDLASSANTEGASLVGVEDAAANFTATNVEAVLAEIIADYAATTNGNGASKIGIEDTGSYYTGTDIEAALAELKPNVGLTSLRGFAEGAGTVDAFTANFTDDVTLTDGIVVMVTAVGQIADRAPTFAPDGLTAHTVKRQDTSSLELTDINTAGQILILQYDLTNTDWLLLNPAIPSFRGAMVTATADLAASNGVAKVIAFAAENYDTDAIHDNSTNNSRLTVPTGATRVRLTGYIMWSPDATGYRGASISKNGSFSYAGRAANWSLSADGTLVHQHEVVSSVLTVIAGDYFELQGSQLSGGNLNIRGDAGADETWFAMEIIE